MQNLGNPAYLMPDISYDAWWNGVPSTFDPVLPPDAWAAHRRVHRYSGNLVRHWGGFRINIDRDYLDVQFGGGGGGGGGQSWEIRGHWAWAPGGLRFAQLAAMNGLDWHQIHQRSLPPRLSG